MKTDTREKIYNLCAGEGGVRPYNIIKVLNISNAAVHRHLRILEAEGRILRKGSPPRVIYVASKGALKEKFVLFPDEIEVIINENFCYFLPNGTELLGVQAFISFLDRTHQDKNPIDRAKEYVEIVQKAGKFQDDSGLIHALEKIKITFGESCLQDVFYSDFYRLPKYGKTKLGQYILHGKSGQNRDIIKDVSHMTEKQIKAIIHKHKIDALCFVPHSIPRKISFLKEFKDNLNICLPEIQVVKMFAGRVPIAQKSLSKLSERIENAQETIFLMDQDIPYKRVLMIDDALGSGATLNEVGKKIMAKGCSVWGYAIVGSYKGFEVLKEI